MKQIILDNQLSPFWITETGQLWREDTNHWYKPFDNGGYLSYHMKWHGKSYPRRIHRLLAEYYIPNPENKPLVHHKDHNHYNNSLDNLEWVTVAENNQDKVSYHFKPQVAPNIEAEDEQWRQYQDTDFWVSDYGRVKNVRTGNILKGNVRAEGYLRVGLRYNNKIHSFNVHNLVWLVWKGKQKGVIDHINGDKLDNRLSNLQDISQSENLVKANKNQMPIGNSITKFGPIISIYKSQAGAARAMNIDTGCINRALHNGTKSCGYYWRKLTEEDYV